MIKQENTKSLTRFELRSCIVGSTANEFIIIAFCYERAGLVAVLRLYEILLVNTQEVVVWSNKYH